MVALQRTPAGTDKPDGWDSWRGAAELGAQATELALRCPHRSGFGTGAPRHSGEPGRGLPGSRPAVAPQAAPAPRSARRGRAPASPPHRGTRFYLLILSANARRSALGSVAMARQWPVGLQGRGVQAAGAPGAAEPLQRMPSETRASSVSRGWKLPHFHLQR